MTQPIRADGQLSPSLLRTSPHLQLAVLAAALALDTGGLGLLNAAIPAVGTDLGLSTSSLQWVITAYAAGFAANLLLAGRLADAFGRRRLFAVGAAVVALGSLVAVVAPTGAVLILGRLVQGAGAALTAPASLALLAQIFPEGVPRNRALSIYAAVGALAFSGGVVVGGVLTEAGGWRSVVAFSLALSVCVLVASALLPESPGTGGHLDGVGGALLAASVCLLVCGSGLSAGGGQSTVIGSLSLCCAAVIAVGARNWERRAPSPLLPPALLRRPTVRAAAVGAFLNYTVGVGMLFFAPLYLQEQLGYSPPKSALAVLPASLVLVTTSSLVTGRLVHRWSTVRVMTLGIGFLGTALLAWLSWPTEAANYWWQVFPGLVLTGIGQGLTYPTMTALGLAEASETEQATAAAVNVTSQQLGASLGVAGLVVAATGATAISASLEIGVVGGYRVAFGIGAGACFAGMALVYRMLVSSPARPVR